VLKTDKIGRLNKSQDKVCVWVGATCVQVYVPHNDQLGRTHFPNNALSSQCIVGT